MCKLYTAAADWTNGGGTLQLSAGFMQHEAQNLRVGKPLSYILSRKRLSASCRVGHAIRSHKVEGHLRKKRQEIPWQS